MVQLCLLDLLIENSLKLTVHHLLLNFLLALFLVHLLLRLNSFPLLTYSNLLYVLLFDKTSHNSNLISLISLVSSTLLGMPVIGMMLLSMTQKFESNTLFNLGLAGISGIRTSSMAIELESFSVQIAPLFFPKIFFQIQLPNTQFLPLPAFHSNLPGKAPL